MPSQDAVYKQIANHYRQKILSGELAPGAKLPTLREIMAERGVTNSTASAAMAELRREGLTVARPRAGTVVAEASSSVASRVQTHASTGRALGVGESSQILEIGTTEADENVANHLNLEPGSLVHVRRRLVSRDGVPTHMTTSYYAPFVIDVTPELTEPVSTGGSRELAAERLGVPQDQLIEEINSRLATEQERQALGLIDGDIVVTQILRTVILTDGRVVEVAIKIASGTHTLRSSTSLRPAEQQD